jgi:hypothetical protein
MRQPPEGPDVETGVEVKRILGVDGVDFLGDRHGAKIAAAGAGRDRRWGRGSGGLDAAGRDGADCGSQRFASRHFGTAGGTDAAAAAVHALAHSGSDRQA